MASRCAKPECDDQAFQELVREHYVTAYGAALAVLKDSHAARDAAQDAFLSAWCSLHQLNDREKARPWIRQIAVNAALAIIRKSWRMVPVGQVDNLVETGGDSAPEESAVREDEVEQLTTAIRRLRDEDRILLALHYKVGLSYGEIAGVMGIPIGTVGSRLNRVRTGLRKILEGSSPRRGVRGSECRQAR